MLIMFLRNYFMQKTEQDKVATFRFIFLAELLGLKVVVTRLLHSNRPCCHGNRYFEKNKAHGHQGLFTIISILSQHTNP